MVGGGGMETTKTSHKTHLKTCRPKWKELENPVGNTSTDPADGGRPCTPIETDGVAMSLSP